MGNGQTKLNIGHHQSGLKPPDDELGGNVRSKSTSNLPSLGVEKKSEARGRSISTVTSPYPPFLTKLAEVLEHKTLEDENCKGIGRATFQKCISKASKSLGNKLFDFFLMEEGFMQHTEEGGSKTLSMAAFIRQSNVHISCLTDSQQLEYYIKVFASGKEEMTYTDFFEMVTVAYEVAQFAHHTGVLPDNLLSAICKAAMHGKERTTRNYILNWISQHCPRIAMWMHRYVNHTLTVGYSTIPKDVETEEDDNVTPVLEEPSASSLVSLHPALIWMLWCSLPQLYTKDKSTIGSPPPEESLPSLRDPNKFIKYLIAADKPSHWIPLFNTNEHGLSINRFMHHAFDYHGPTLLFITTDDETTFCLASDEEWRDSKHFYGGVDAMLFQLYPEYKIIERGAKILYFNTTSRGFPTGLQVGTDSTNRTLAIDVHLEFVHFKKIPYRLKSLEVWGCGTTYAREKQMEYKTQVRKDVEKRRKVNMTMEWKDNPDRYLLEMAGGRPNYARFEKDTQNHSSLK